MTSIDIDEEMNENNVENIKIPKTNIYDDVDFPYQKEMSIFFCILGICCPFFLLINRILFNSTNDITAYNISRNAFVLFMFLFFLCFAYLCLSVMLI